MSTNRSYVQLDKNKLETYFSDLGKLLRKKYKLRKSSVEIIVVGGASIVLNYGFRQSTTDIDCYDTNGLLMNDLVNEISDKYNLPSNWINTDFVFTKSFSDKLIQHSSFYKTYGNGSLNVRTIKDEYLIAMKLKASRIYKFDISDIYGIVQTNKKITYNMVEKAIIDLYGTLDGIEQGILDFVKRIIESDDSTQYLRIRDLETNNKAELEKVEIKDDKFSNLDELLKSIDNHNT